MPMLKGKQEEESILFLKILDNKSFQTV